MNRIPTIGVMGSHNAEATEYAVPVGRMVATLDCNLLTGGGKGVMTSTSAAYSETPQAQRRGRCIGVVPTIKTADGRLIAKDGYPNPYVEIPVISPLPVFSGGDGMTPNRNHINILSSDIVIALEGGPGTANEIDLALLFGKPLILFRPPKTLAGLPKGLINAQNIDEVEAFVLEHLAKLSYKPARS